MLPVLGPLKRYMTPTLDSALLLRSLLRNEIDGHYTQMSLDIFSYGMHKLTFRGKRLDFTDMQTTVNIRNYLSAAKFCRELPILVASYTN